METRKAELKRLEKLFAEEGNGLALVYGKRGNGIDGLLKSFCAGKNVFFYCAREASEKEQLSQIKKEFQAQFDAPVNADDYVDIFDHIKGTAGKKLVVIIDEFDRISKKDKTFLEAVVMLKDKKLYQGPVMIILSTSSIVYAEGDLRDDMERSFKKIDDKIKLCDLSFLEVVRQLPDVTVADAVRVYGITGGVLSRISGFTDTSKSFKENICENILTPNGFLYNEAENYLRSELRELAVYETILSQIAGGNDKLNDMHHNTGFSRAKISVYMKNLAAFDCVDKVVSFETGGWENAKKGVYRMKDTFLEFWFRFVYPNLSALKMIEPGEFYDKYIEPGLDDWLNPVFTRVCLEYLELMNKAGKLNISLKRMGTWVGKEGKIDIIAADDERNILVGVCNWSEPVMSANTCIELSKSMKKAKIKSANIYLFSATSFDPALQMVAQRDPRFTLVDMSEL